MSKEVTYFWYTTGGYPRRQTITKKNGVVVAISNPYDEQADIPITEQQYDNLIAQQEADVAQAKIDAQTASDQARADRQALLASANAKLVSGTPLTQAEADALTT